MQKLFLSLVLSSSFFVSGCIPLILGGAAAAGYMGNQERGVQAAVSDLNIKTHIKDKLTSQYYKYLTQIEVSVLKGDVLLTGVVKSPKAAAEAESVVRSVEGVKGVFNELFTDGIYPASRYASDSWLSTQLKSYMLTTDNIHSSNYQVLVVNGHAYVFGLASDMSEKEAVNHLIRTTKGVVRVHNYVSLYKEEFKFKIPRFGNPSVDSEGAIEE